MYSDFVKHEIMECYNIVREFLEVGQLGSEDLYFEMEYDLAAKKVAIPQEVYKIFEGMYLRKW